MHNCHLVLVPCQHGGSPTGEECGACEGSGYVRVVTALDGQPKPCQHASNEAELEDCDACLGSGWAGLED